MRARLWRLPSVLLALALTAFSVALARPVSRDVLPLREQGIDIMLVLDISSSMMATDMDRSGRVTRMQAARECAAEFAAARTNDRVGLLTFARFPEQRCPMTLDQDALGAFLRTVRTVPQNSSENQTGIGVALAKATTLLEKSEAKSKVIVLLSDGENNILDITPEDAARLAKDADVKVHCIGLGIGQRISRNQWLKPEFKSLKAISEIAEGEFHEAESGDELKSVYARIDAMEKVEIEDPRFRTVERYRLPFLVGAGLLLLQLLVEFLWIRRTP